MVKKLLYALLITDRLKFEADKMTITFLALYFVSGCIMLLSGSLAVSALFCFMRAVTWMSIAWLWADILWLGKYALLKDRGKYL